MLLQAAGLALLASLSPTALLIAAVYLGSERPRATATIYLTGALVMSVVMGAVILVVLRSADLSVSTRHTQRYDLRLGLGLALLAVGAVLARRKPRTPDAEGESQGLVYRMAARPTLSTAFFVGLLVFAPGATFLAALQVIATAKATPEVTILAVSIVVVLNALLVWLPILFHVIAPEATTRYLAAFNGWLRAHGRAILVWVFIVVGAIMVGNGIYGLTVG